MLDMKLPASSPVAKPSGYNDMTKTEQRSSEPVITDLFFYANFFHVRLSFRNTLNETVWIQSVRQFASLPLYHCQTILYVDFDRVENNYTLILT